ncbi:MAG: hypothetical protein RIC87_15540 [Kiloniellales bacterium]
MSTHEPPKVVDLTKLLPAAEPAPRQFLHPEARELCKMDTDLSPLQVDGSIQAIYEMAAHIAVSSLRDWFWQQHAAGNKDAGWLIAEMEKAVGFGPIRPTFPGDVV